ncbi:hypothetical protein ACFL2P_01645 [Candidatus Moduliflexota bacterium]
MTTAKQLEANRKNAQKSTGPRTPKGKSVSRLNALKHGLLSKEVLLPSGEQKEALEAFSGRLRADLRPEGEMEHLLVDRIVAATWRLRRVLQVEAEVYEDEGHGDSFTFRRLDEYQGPGHAFHRVAGTRDTFLKLSRYEAAIERSLYRALHELQRLQAARMGNTPPPPAVLDITGAGGNHG